MPLFVVPGYYFWNGTKWHLLVIPAGTSGQTLRYDGGNWIPNSVLFNDGTNIGIGATEPSHKLTIDGSDQTLRLIGTGNYGQFSKLNFGDENYVFISEDLDDHLLIHAVSRTAITGGNVGIGTMDPGQKLTVAGTIETTSGGVKFPDGTVQTTAAGTHTIGESYGGGVVFYVYDNGQHGLIAAAADQSFGLQWYNGTYRITGTTGDGLNAGTMNTAMIVASQMADNQSGDFAAKVCADYSVTAGGITYGDWYLPSKYELNLLYQQKNVVGGFTGYHYWSSTEWGGYFAWAQFFSDGTQTQSMEKIFPVYVRAIRAF
jgi:hypothetical protein